MKAREVIRMIEQDGWYRVRATGGHRQFKHPTEPGQVTILPGCVAVGQDTPEAAKRLITAAIETRIHGMIEDGLPVPEPSSRAEYVQAVA